MRDEVLVIGAGPAGISSAYYLKRAGLPYRVVDRAAVPASTWANLYPSLQLNTAGFVSHLPGERIPLRFGVFPMGRDYYAYLRDYVDHHRLQIDYGVEVLRVSPGSDGWCVETRRVDAEPHETAIYRAVIIAAGRFGNPVVPPIPGAFNGRLLHARDFHDPAAFAGRRVLVVGSGPSGVDIAAALADVTPPVSLAIRNDIVVARKYPYGLPNTAWQILLSPLPPKWRKPLLDRIVYQGYRDADDIGLKFAPNREDRRGTGAPVRGHELIDAIRAGKIKPVAGLAALDGDHAVMDDGQRLAVDTIIFGTGYRPVLDFLDFPYQLDSDGWHIRLDPDTYQVSGQPGLFVVGWFYRGLGPMHNIRAEARTVVRGIEQLWGRVSRL
ncbi:MAG: NAD(P)/FAD-dependent oxidoreductase [Anaerolinea sp.]|nr:NAD(P)/FAD-dependent oxidoreductase [Anaerolinea sp.]